MIYMNSMIHELGQLELLARALGSSTGASGCHGSSLSEASVFARVIVHVDSLVYPAHG